MSRVTIIKCDRCGCEITGKHAYRLMPQVVETDTCDISQEQPYHDEWERDYCGKCAGAALNFLHQTPEAAGEIPPLMKKPARRKSTLDEGKVQALKKAGWTNTKIADEMGVTSTTIANCLKRCESHSESGQPTED